MNLQRLNLKGNLFGGLTAGVVALPLGLAFGVASGAGPAAGLYGAATLGLLAALCGGTRTQISGPTGPMTVITASAIAAFAGDWPAVLAVTLAAGAFQILFGAFRLGGFVKFIPYPVISGFMSGIGVIIILLQLHPLLGAPAVSSPLGALAEAGAALAHLDPAALALGAGTMLIVFLTPPRVTRVIPSPLMALVAGTAAAYTLGLPVATIGEIPAGLPTLQWPACSLAQLPRVVGFGLTLGILGAIDTLLTSIVADSLTKEAHNSNRELIGQGIGNMAVALVGGLAGAGATMRTVVNIKAGGTSRLSGVVHALFLLSVLAGVGPLAAHIPMAVLAGILIKVGVDILDYRMLRLIRKAPRQDLLVMGTVFAVTVLVDLIIAVVVGVTLASVLLTYRIARQTRINIMEVEKDPAISRQEKALQERSAYRIRTVSVQGPFFFGTTANMQDKVTAVVGAEAVIINCLDVPFMDISAIFALGEMVGKLRRRGIRPFLVVTDEQHRALAELDAYTALQEGEVCRDFDQAVQAAQEVLGEGPVRT